MISKEAQMNMIQKWIPKGNSSDAEISENSERETDNQILKHVTVETTGKYGNHKSRGRKKTHEGSDSRKRSPKIWEKTEERFQRLKEQLTLHHAEKNVCEKSLKDACKYRKILSIFSGRRPIGNF